MASVSAYARLAINLQRSAANVRTLGKIADRLGELLSTDQITDDEHDELTGLLNARHDEIEPQPEVAT